jgi:hypothetical protein
MYTSTLRPAAAPSGPGLKVVAMVKPLSDANHAMLLLSLLVA